MWASNGNELSKIYAGTGVIGTSSKLVDGARSAARTVQNNLLDSAKQEAFDRIVSGGIFKTQGYSYSFRVLIVLRRFVVTDKTFPCCRICWSKEMPKDTRKIINRASDVAQEHAVPAEGLRQRPRPPSDRGRLTRRHVHIVGKVFN